MPSSWIQDIYLRLSKSENAIATHIVQLDQIQDLLRQNQELQSALDIATSTIAELEVRSQKVDPTSSTPTSSNSPSSSQRADDGPSGSKWADLAATPPPAISPKPARAKAPPTTITTVVEDYNGWFILFDLVNNSWEPQGLDAKRGWSRRRALKH
ncbi:hypothetical protein HMPREF1544_07093 [Mucor circinelloides 1006PhL]|uniref:Uncharacterized protein n=1 Tax=Mucor circinelloides f. circinelloides (strain 1006PhL) TaxID=1220926 RepID=S2K1R0_MUCC1|nr:hypothetical protein HMPREF1544_07093 [Mucor circinelloides 1006PhL]